MLNNFDIFGFEHIISMIIPIIVGIVFIILAKKYPEKRKIISIILAITIVLTRGIRYGFDLYVGRFEILDLVSLHVCHIDLILLIFCLIKPNRKIFVFNFLIGIPTALAVALMPGQTHPEPGMLRAIFFIMSHMMLVMGAMYILATYKFKLTKKDLMFYYLFSWIGIVIIYAFNFFASANFMYLMKGPENTVLEVLYNFFGPFWYIISIYTILVSMLTIIYFLYKLVIKLVKEETSFEEVKVI